MTKDRVILRPATKQDVESFYGDRPLLTVRAIVAELDGDVVAIAGFAMHQGLNLAFSDLRENTNASRVMIVKYAKKMAHWMRDTGLPIYVTENPQRSNSHRFLSLMGFVEVDRQHGIGIYKLGRG